MVSSFFEGMGVIFVCLIVFVLAMVGIGRIKFGTLPMEEGDDHGE